VQLPGLKPLLMWLPRSLLRPYLDLLSQFTVGFVSGTFLHLFVHYGNFFFSGNGLASNVYFSQTAACTVSFLFSLRQLLVCPLYFLAGL
jgi:hypothetical protein